MRAIHSSLIGASLAVLSGQAVLAREPGVAPSFPPGLTLGFPMAAPLPNGIYFQSITSYYSAKLYDDDGNYRGQQANITSEVLKLIWSPGWTIFGASYRGFISQPLVNIDMTRTTTQVGPIGKFNGNGLGNLKVQPIDLSWKLADGFFFSAGFGFYAPMGGWEKGAAVNTGADFWTFEPSAALTYLKDGWNATIQLVYNTNTENSSNQYLSGDQVFLNFTVTKDFDGWKIGPVAYYDKQVTEDVNNGGPTTYGGRTFGEPEQFAIGAVLNRQFGPYNLNIVYTHDALTQNTYGGDRFWAYLTLKFP